MRTKFDVVTGTRCYNQSIPEARWNVPGLFVFDDIYFELWEIDEEYYSGKPPVHSISGSRSVKWNSGRVTKNCSNAGASKAIYRNRLEAYKAFGVNCFYTFSNNLITKADLEDSECNEMLEAMAETAHEGDGVILSSEILSDYLHKNFPTLKQKVSVIKSDVERQRSRNAQWYYDLEQRYDIVVLQPDDNFNVALLTEIKNKERFELLVNEGCVRNCPYRKQHYDAMSNIALKGYTDFSPISIYTGIGNRCGQFNYSHPTPSKRPTSVSCRMKNNEVSELYDLGFRHFKLQGRTNPIKLAYDIAYYMYDDGDTGKSIYNAMINAIQGAS